MRCEFAVLLLMFFFSLIISPVRSQFRFTLPPPDIEEGPSQTFEDSQGEVVETPKGIFHYSDTEQNIESKFKLPDLQEMDPMRIAQDLMSAAAKAQTRRKTLGGFNIPLPIGGTPLNLQLSSDTRSGISVSEERESSSQSIAVGPAKEAFEKAKSVCLNSNADSCDEALDTYYRVKYGSSLMPSTSQSEDPSTDLATLMVPGLEKRLSALVALKNDQTTISLRRRNPERNSQPPRLPPRSSMNTVNQIRGFLERIN